MPAIPITLKPGVNAEMTPALNEAGWSETENIRFFQGLVQKIGGFRKLCQALVSPAMPQLGRSAVALRPWQALSGLHYLAIAGENRISLFGSDVVSDITPLTIISEIPIALSTVAGSAIITINDPINTPPPGTWLRIRGPISVGGVVLVGSYGVMTVVDQQHYTITSSVSAATSVNNGGEARRFATQAANDIVTVTLAKHGLVTGQVARVEDPVSVGGLILEGNFLATVVDSNTYTIQASSAAIVDANVLENGGNLNFVILNPPRAAASATVANISEADIALMSGYVPGVDILSLSEGSGGLSPTFLVTHTQISRIIEIKTPGTGGANGIQIVRTTTGTGTKAEIRVLIVDGGISSVIKITNHGDYTTNPLALEDEPIAGAGLVGAVLSIEMGALTVSIATPGSLVAPPNSPAETASTAFGVGAALDVEYAAGVGTAQNTLEVEDVTLDNWGEFLLAIPKNEPVSVWMPKNGVAAMANVTTAPQANTSGFVSGQQQILVLCGTVDFASGLFDPLLVRWSDSGDYTWFTPLAENQAGSFRLQLGSAIVAGTALAAGALIWTDLALYAMQYLGPPLVWGFQPIGRNCGLVGPKAFGLFGTNAVWMSQEQFYLSSGGSAPEPISCPVWDRVFKNVDRANIGQTVCATNAYFNEVAWYVPQSDGTIVKAKAKIDTREWDYTIFEIDDSGNRSAATDQNIFGPPMGATPGGTVYQEETGTDADGHPLSWRILSGIASIANGDSFTFFKQIIPDIKFSNTPAAGPGTVSVKIFVYRNPQDAPVVKGPYPINARTRSIMCRSRGAGLQFEFSGNDLGSSPRLGKITYTAQPDGRGG